MLNDKLICQSCGRDFGGDDELKPGDKCPATDDCPSYFEEKGRAHPDHPRNIKVRYSSVDGGGAPARTFKTLKGAQKFAHQWVGAHPEIGSTYAVSGDGIGKVTVSGASLRELFPSNTGALNV